MMKKIKHIQKGFTFIELILYIALISIFITGAVLFTWDVVYGREKAFQQLIVDQSARIAMERISHEIRNAKDIQYISSDQLILDMDGSSTTIDYASEKITMTTSTGDPYDLSSNQVRVTSFLFEDLTQVANHSSKNVRFSATFEQAQTGVSGQLTAFTVVEESVELNSQFNESRKLLVDVSGFDLIGGTSIEGITIQNTGIDDLTIDKMIFSWTDTPGGENITSVQIGAGGVEWTGSEGAGNEIDIMNFILASTDGVVDVNYFLFDTDMYDAVMVVDWILADGSMTTSEFMLPSAATPTPTPTPTDTPTPTPTPTPATCSSYCISIDYSDGTCRQNSVNCNKNSETHESGGDIYCTGGPSADTCCCVP